MRRPRLLVLYSARYDSIDDGTAVTDGIDTLYSDILTASRPLHFLHGTIPFMFSNLT